MIASDHTTVSHSTIDWPYYMRQFEQPYSSTVALYDWLKSLNVFKDHSAVADFGAGSGAVMYYFGKNEPSVNFVGFDIEKPVIEYGNQKFNELNLKNCRLEYGDIRNIDTKYRSSFDGIFCTHFLLIFEDFESPLTRFIQLNPKWIAVNSLFFEGQVNTIIRRQDYNDPVDGKPYRESHYNIYSIPLVRDFFKKNGYMRFEYKKFEIDVDIPKTSNDLGTYTEQTADGRRLQISGPLLMNWYFIFASR